MSFDFLRKIASKRHSIEAFSTEIMRFRASKQQSQLFKTVEYEVFAPQKDKKKGIFVASGQGCGKTATTCVVASWWLFLGYGSRVVVTAPTMRQVRDVWMSEFRQRVMAADPGLGRLLTIDTTRVSVKGFRDWEIATVTSNKPENVQGYHRDRMLFICDEASGIPRPIWQTIKGTLTQENNLMLGIGNPNDRDTEFFDAFNKDSHLYHLYNWSSLDSPHVDRKHIDKMREEYGEESDVYRVRVLGQFPRESPVSVIRYEDLLYCCRKVDSRTAISRLLASEGRNTRQIGIDLARFGGDESVVVARFNGCVLEMKTFVKEEPAAVIAWAFDLERRLLWDPDTVTYCVDAGGMGQGVMHLFHESGRNVFEFHSQGKPFEVNTFHDAITEAYFALRTYTRERLIKVPENQMMFSQLVDRQYRYTDGKFRLESKDEYMKRKGTEEFTSPDRADAVALAFYPYASGRMQVA